MKRITFCFLFVVTATVLTSSVTFAGDVDNEELDPDQLAFIAARSAPRQNKRKIAAFTLTSPTNAVPSYDILQMGVSERENKTIGRGTAKGIKAFKTRKDDIETGDADLDLIKYLGRDDVRTGIGHENKETSVPTQVSERRTKEALSLFSGFDHRDVVCQRDNEANLPKPIQFGISAVLSSIRLVESPDLSASSSSSSASSSESIPGTDGASVDLSNSSGLSVGSDPEMSDASADLSSSTGSTAASEPEMGDTTPRLSSSVGSVGGQKALFKRQPTKKIVRPRHKHNNSSV